MLQYPCRNLKLLCYQELPAPPGCRSVVTQKCHKVPEVYPKKVPREECREVPGVNCYLELELVETPKCYPVPVEECDDILKVGENDENNMIILGRSGNPVSGGR